MKIRMTVKKAIDLKKVEEYAFNCHSSTNHTYGNNPVHPYSYHLGMAKSFAIKYSKEILGNVDNVIAAVLCHDLIEDTRQTYNDVKQNTNEEVAELVYAVTNEKGKTRKDRSNGKYYHGIRNLQDATFVKLCDKLANCYNGKVTGNSMFNKYIEEYSMFKQVLYIPGQYETLWTELEKILFEPRIGYFTRLNEKFEVIEIKEDGILGLCITKDGSFVTIDFAKSLITDLTLV